MVYPCFIYGLSLYFRSYPLFSLVLWPDMPQLARPLAPALAPDLDQPLTCYKYHDEDTRGHGPLLYRIS